MNFMFRKAGIAAMVALSALVLGACGSGGTGGGGTPTRITVGAIHVGSITDAGYNQAEHAGLVYMTQHVSGVKLIEASNVPEDPGVVTVMQNMISQGATVIFPQSYGYQDFALQVAGSNTNVTFEHPAGYKSATNFGTYWAASDDYSYTLGVAAGLMTKKNKLGFIGGFPIPQIVDSIDAFHLGARSVNPNVTTIVVWDNTWSDPAKETTATNALADQGVDVVTGIVDSPVSFVKTAESRGIMSIGYHSAAVASFAPNGWISGIDFQFGPLFTQMVNNVLNKTWTAKNYIAPIESGTVKLAPYGKNVPAAVQSKTNAVEQEFVSGTRTSPFIGPIYDQSGKLQVPAGQTPSDPNFANDVNWFAQGIQGSPTGS
jgi:basic membrane protein A and related proteins